MANMAVILFLVYFFNLSSGYVLMDDEENLKELLMLPSEYYIKAERIDMIGTLKTPMELWYSSDYNRSRVDVYNGMVRRYYYWGDDGATGTDGQVYMAYPKWTKKEGHTVYCATPDIDDGPPTDAFPPEEEYVYTGKKMHEGKNVDVWRFEEDDEDTRREVVLYSYRTATGEDVPVHIFGNKSSICIQNVTFGELELIEDGRVENKEMNKVKGSIEKHVIVNYEQYDPLLCEEDVDAEKEGACEWTPDDFDGHMKMLHPAFHGHLDKAFDSFKKHHTREYQNKRVHDMRKEIFHKNWQLVMDHNRQDLGYKLALNHLSDLTPAERAHMKGARRSRKPSATHAFPHSAKEVSDIVTQIPEEYDMRLEGFISPIKNQDNCGSCWSFATTAAVEGALARLDGRILDLSEQSIVDCSWEGDNTGCDGGWPKSALEHIVKHGLPLDEEYGGYLAENGYCHIENVTEVFKIRGFTLVTPQSVNAMKVALYKYGPVIVTIQANNAFDFYHSGVFYDTTCKDFINHAVIIVGYGVRDGAEYWIVKNSYGQQWGEGGYMLMSQFNDNCFVLDEPYYPVV